MKTTLLGAAVAVAVTSAAGVVHAQDFTTGYVGGSYTSINTSSAGGIDDTSILAARAVGSFQLGKGVETQIDGDIASVDTGFPNASSVTTFGPTGHLFFESESGSKAGFILGYQDIGDISVITYGAEARFAATDNLSLGAVAVWGQVNTPGTNSNADVHAYEGEVSYFVNENARVDFSFNSSRLYGSLTPSTLPLHVSVQTYHLGGELQLENAPVSITAGYNRYQNANSSYDGFSVGVRHSFGGTLKDRDRTSSPFKGMSSILGDHLIESELAIFDQCVFTTDEDACFDEGDDDNNNTAH